MRYETRLQRRRQNDRGQNDMGQNDMVTPARNRGSEKKGLLSRLSDRFQRLSLSSRRHGREATEPTPGSGLPPGRELNYSSSDDGDIDSPPNLFLKSNDSTPQQISDDLCAKLIDSSPRIAHVLKKNKQCTFVIVINVSKEVLDYVLSYCDQFAFDSIITLEDYSLEPIPTRLHVFFDEMARETLIGLIKASALLEMKQLEIDVCAVFSENFLLGESEDDINSELLSSCSTVMERIAPNNEGEEPAIPDVRVRRFDHYEGADVDGLWTSLRNGTRPLFAEEEGE